MPFALSVRFFCRLDDGPHAEDGVGVVRAGRQRVVLGQLAGAGRWMAIELVLNPLTPSTPGVGRERERVEGVERSEPGQVEDRAEVDEEGVVALAGEELGAVATAS